MTDKKFNHIVRIANADLEGGKPVSLALTKIKGVGRMYANMVCFLAKIDKDVKAGYLSDEDVDKINDVLSNPSKYSTPEWMLNRRKDPEDGEDKHLVSSDLTFTNQNDVRRLQRIRAYRGFRHQAGLPSRGQRTKSNFRRNRGKVVGVRKKKGSKSGRV